MGSFQTYHGLDQQGCDSSNKKRQTDNPSNNTPYRTATAGNKDVGSIRPWRWSIHSLIFYALSPSVVSIIMASWLGVSAMLKIIEFLLVRCL